jgi:CheY-like chemotaxis protein
LVIEADSSERSVLNVAFASGGFEVVSVETGAQAMRRLSSPGVRFDAVLVDAALRGEDGYSLCAQIKGDSRVADLPVWLISPKPAGEDKELGQVVGAEGVVGKPTYVRDVVVLVRLRLAPKHDDGSVSFDTEALPLGHLLRAVLSAGLSGAISFQHGRGSIRFRGNKVLESRFCGVGGTESLIRALALAVGTYSVRIGQQKGLPQFHFTLTELVTSAFPRLNKWNEVLARSVPLDAQLGVDFGRLKAALATMPDGVNDVVRLFDGVRTVRSVLMDSPLNESTSLAITTRLYLMGVVAPLPKFPPGQELLAAPPIFEPAPLEAEEAMRALFNVVPMQVASDDQSPQTSDWSREPQGTGLEVANPTDGWTAGPITEATPEVQALIERQFAAFNVQPIVEASTPAALTPEMSDFNEGYTFEHRPPPGLEYALVQFERSQVTEVLTPTMTENTSVIEALEMDFFRETEVITKPEGKVAKAVLGITAEHPMERLPERNPLWLVGTMAVALVTVTALAAWIAAPRVNRSAPWTDAIMAQTDPFAPSVYPYPEPLVPVPPGAEAEASLAGVPLVTPLPEPTKVDSIDQNEINKLINDATTDYERGRVKDAIAKLETVLAQSPSETQAWVQLGLARYDSGDNTGAEEAALTALAMAPENARAHLLLATVAQQTGRKEQARIELETYLKLDPKGPFADEARALLRGR